MQKINQKILSLLLALTMVVSLLSPVTNVAWAEDAAGNTELKAGDNVTAGGNYTLSKDIAAGTLLISPLFIVQRIDIAHPDCFPVGGGPRAGRCPHRWSGHRRAPGQRARIYDPETAGSYQCRYRK